MFFGKRRALGGGTLQAKPALDGTPAAGSAICSAMLSARRKRDRALLPGLNGSMISMEGLQVLLRPSRRARRLILRLLSPDTLEVVLPPGVRGSEVPAFLERHSEWIRTARARQTAHPDSQERKLPTAVHLRAVDEFWTVQSVFLLGNSVQLLEAPSVRTLTLQGSVDQLSLSLTLLQGWLKRKAREVLVPWLERTRIRTGLSFRHVTIRLQRSRWGSCSSRQRINLNARLMLIAPELVDYLLVHELCHTRELNHSERFWTLVKQHCPDYRSLDRRLSLAGRELPLWSQA